MAEAEAERTLKRVKRTSRPRSESSTRISRWSKAPAPPQPPPKPRSWFSPRSKPRPEPPTEPGDPFTRLSADPMLPFTGPIEPDDTSARDLDNASPLTLGLCEKFPCHYCIFVYSRPSDVDEDTSPFRRNEFVARINDAPHDETRRRILNSPEYRDAIRDRRVVYIEINTSCRIRLSELEGRKSMKKGLPRRRLTIAGPTFSHICVAVQLLEHMFPRLMQYALYPYRLPSPASANYTSKDKLTVNYSDYVTRQPAWLGLVPDIVERGSWRKFWFLKNGRNGIDYGFPLTRTKGGMSSDYLSSLYVKQSLKIEIPVCCIRGARSCLRHVQTRSRAFLATAPILRTGQLTDSDSRLVPENGNRE
ncbi:unnamed protein product [Schistocephalus solidus]|uniref:Uncharacterized protein n=1 Tax=Schistocephalus solidus TaxID=70667 RepID=A0A183SUQ1_SCHSO|nr:unnamed protein product [Schistocephalus solidus]